MSLQNQDQNLPTDEQIQAEVVRLQNELDYRRKLALPPAPPPPPPVSPPVVKSGLSSLNWMAIASIAAVLISLFALMRGGPTGPEGKQGLQGVQGIQGVAGVAGPQGLTGSEGLKGDTGAVGPQGLQGVAGPAGPAGSSYSNATQWYYNTYYNQGDVVYYNGVTYTCIIANRDIVPSSSNYYYWSSSSNYDNYYGLTLGNSSIERASVQPAGGLRIDANHLSNDSGTITSIQVDAKTDITGLIVGVFRLVGTDGDTGSFRLYNSSSYASIGTVQANSVTSIYVSLSVPTAGLYLGYYFDSGSIYEASGTGTPGIWNSTNAFPTSSSQIVTGTLASGYIDSIEALGN